MSIKHVLPVILIGILLLSGYHTTNAQSPESWRITVFDRITGRLHYLTPSGIQPGPVVPLPEEYMIVDVSLSPDEHYLVFRNNNSILVSDLVAGTCCVALNASDPTYFPTYISPISPDSTQIAVSMSTEAIFTTPDVDLPVMIFDLASGEAVTTLSASQLQAADYPPSAVQFGKWLADGLRVTPSCWGCEGTWEGTYQIWDPAVGSLSEPVEPFNILMNKLPGTGEMLKAIANPAYPQSGFPTAYYAAPNVVEYYSSIQSPDASIVYFNPNNVYVGGVSWVAGGQAFLAVLGGKVHSSADNPFVISPDNESVLVFRDGHQIPVSMPGYGVLTGTPDGWIARSWETGDAVVVQLLPGDQLNIIPINTSKSGDWEIVAMNFQLGEATSVSAFPAAYQPPAFAACPGFMTSRLWPNTYATVSPGNVGNVFSTPDTQGTLISSISEYEMFAVIAGPECAENTAWWQVEYMGTEGWIAEGQGDTYWLRPIGEGFY